MVDVATAALLSALAWFGYHAEWQCHTDSYRITSCGIFMH